MPSTPKTLYLIDGHAQIFRAYYAIRGGMTSPVTGEPTQAVFAFAGMLLKLFERFEPHYVAMIIDMPGKTFRDELYPEYKAHRESPPDDFGPQVQRILEMTRLFGIPVIGVQGAEADDVIATCVDRVLADGGHDEVRVRIVSKDKDLEQLLCDRVTMFDIHTDTTIDVGSLKKDKGISPEQVADVLALSGDKVDNIPGVDGIGPKTAAKLIQDYGSVQGVLDHLDDIKGKRRENLENARETLPLSLKLVQLKRDVPFDFSMDKARAGEIDAQALKRFFKEMGFRRHVDDLERLLATHGHLQLAGSGDGQGTLFGGEDIPEAAFASEGTATRVPENVSTAADFEYTGITTQAQLDQLARDLRQAGAFAFDTETSALGHRSELCGLSFAWEAGKAVYVPVKSPHCDAHLDRDTVLGVLKPVLEDPKLQKIAHNAKYDVLVLRYNGVGVQGLTFDTMIASFLLGYPGQGLDDLALSALQHSTIPITDLIGPKSRGRKGIPGDEQKSIDQVDLEKVTIYAAEDADLTYRLWQKFAPELEKQGMNKLAEEVEMPLVEVLADMEYHGIRLVPKVLAEQKEELIGRIDGLRRRILELAGTDFNVDSPKQLGEVLFTHMQLPVIKRTKTGPSTDAQVLNRLAEHADLSEQQRAVPAAMLEYRELTKLVNTYLEQLQESVRPETGRIHASFLQTGAATGRLSSSGPNLQNIPIRTEIGQQVRKAFIADEGHRLISADYSQIELRLLAHLSQDPKLIEAFQSDQDIHTAVAAQVFGVPLDQVTSTQRGSAKTINFGIIYGVTAFGLAQRIAGLDRTDAAELIKSYRQRFAGIDTFLQRCIEEAEKHGYVTTIMGRRRAIPEIQSQRGQQRSLGERLAINSVVQGSAADLIKLAMVNLFERVKRERLPLRMLVQVHDELVCEAPTDQAEQLAQVVKEEMERAMDLRVPLKVEAGIGENWLEAK